MPLREHAKFWASKVRARFRDAVGYPVIHNANKVDESRFSKRALFIYLVKPFLLEDNHRAFISHQSMQQAKIIASILGEFGFIVDVVDIKDRRFRPARMYDAVISHKVNITDIEHHIKNVPIKIYLSSGMNHLVHNENLRRRLRHLQERRGCTIDELIWDEEEMPFLNVANAIIGFGNDVTMNSWGRSFSSKRCPFNNYGFPLTRYSDKNFDRARKHFLFFGSTQQLGKGLDLLLEVFVRHPDLHLFICGAFDTEPSFARCYHKELFGTSNIHFKGWVRVGSSEFEDLVSTCAFVVLPSCSEGQPGSVVQCMWAGLIPVLTKECGIHTDRFGITFPDDSIPTIEQTIVSLANRPATWLEEASKNTRRIAEEEYSELAFRQSWRSILGSLISENKNTSVAEQ